jgi:glycosyltransferase involved in cell wall biosynthesis
MRLNLCALAGVLRRCLFILFLRRHRFTISHVKCHPAPTGNRNRSSRLRVLHCIPSLAGGGAERQLSYLTGGLVNAGVEVHVAYHTSGEFRESLEQAGAVLHPLRLPDNHSPALVAQMVRVIRKIQPDLVQTWLLQMDVAGGLAALFTHIPFILSERASAPAYPKSWKTAARKWIGTRAVFVAANSHGGRAYWTLLRDPESVKVIRNGVPFEHLERSSSLQCDAPLALDPGVEIILFAGRFSAEKNVRALVEAMPQVLMRRPKSIALLFGNGPLKTDLVRYIEQRKIASRVKILDFTSQLCGWMKRASVFLCVSRFEGNPNVVLEAAALRCPLVLSDIPAHTEMFSENAAFFVDPSSASDIAKGIIAALEDRELAKKNSALASELVSQYSIDCTVPAYLSLYQQAIAR